MSDKPFSLAALVKYGDSLSQSTDTKDSSFLSAAKSNDTTSRQISEAEGQYIINSLNRLVTASASTNNLYSTYQSIQSSSYGSDDKIISSRGANTYYLQRTKKPDLFLSKVEHKFSIIINPTSSGRFSGIYSEFVVESDDGRQSATIPIVITEEEYFKGNFGKKLNRIITNRNHPDYKSRYAVSLYLYLVQSNISMKENCFIPPSCSGWSMHNNGLFFASNHSIDQLIYDYLDKSGNKDQIPCYPPDLINRKLLFTDRVFKDVANEYRDRLPNIWKYKLIVTIRIASLLLYFFKDRDIEPQQLFVITPTNESNVRAITSLIQTSNYTDYSPLSFPFTEPKYTKTIYNEFISNDGVSLFRDTSHLEERFKVKSSINLLLNSLRYTDTAYGKKRHIVAIITNNPSNLCVDESDAMYLTFNESDLVLDEQYIRKLQRLSGEFDFSLIQEIMNNQESFTNKIYSLIADNKPTATDENFEKINTIHILQATMAFLRNYGILSDTDIKHIQDWFSSCENDATDNQTNIVNDFYNSLNLNIRKGRIRLANQFSEPFYAESQSMAFESNGYLNFGDDVLKKIILPSMKSTKQSGIVLNSLFDSGIFPPAKGNKKSNTIRENKRTLVVEKANGSRSRVSVYSVTTELLDFQSNTMLDAVRNYDFFYPSAQIPESEFSPIVSSIDSKLTAGVKIAPDSDENFHMYVTGSSGIGKSYFLMQQALFRAQTDDKVIIFDNGGYFRPEKLMKIFHDKTDDIIEEYISFHYIPEDKIPVNLFSLENCEGEGSSLRHSQVMRLYNILTAASSNLGEKQKTALTNALIDIVPRIKSPKLANVSDEYFIQKICDLISEMLQLTKIITNGIDERLSSIVSHIRGRGMLRQTWGEFLDKQKKIVVITTERERNKLGGNLIDLMLASLSAYKSYTESPRYTVIIDEISFLNLSSTGTPNSFAREGRHKNISLLLASQDFMNDKLNDMFGNFGTMVFFKPTDEKTIASYINSPNINSDILRNLKIGECVVKGYIHSKSQNENTSTTISGKTADFVGSLFFPIDYPITEKADEIHDEAEADLIKINNQAMNECSEVMHESHDVYATDDFQDVSTIGMSENTASTVKQKANIPANNEYIIRVIVLVEDTTGCKSKPERGLSLYIEYNDRRILFDAGLTGLFAENAKSMLIDLSKIDFAILSHGHHTHSDGFVKFFKLNEEAPVYAREEVFEEYYSGSSSTKYIEIDEYSVEEKITLSANNQIYIGISSDLKSNRNRFTLLNQSQKIDKDIYIVEHNEPDLEKLGEKQYLFKYILVNRYGEMKHIFIPDDLKHEQNLVLDTPKGLIIISGSSHSGIINTIIEAKRMCGGKSIYAYIGGVCMRRKIYDISGKCIDEYELDNTEIQRIGEVISKEDIPHIYIGRVSDEDFERLDKYLGDRVHRLTTGLEFKL